MGQLDLISELPKNIIENILTHLPLREAVRTSILSSRWRYAWAALPCLDFREEFFDALCEDLSHEEIASIIDQILLLHVGPINSFKFNLDLDDCSSYVDRWILFLSRNSIQELGLQFIDDEEGPYKVPSSLFSCQQLRDLVLHNCILKEPGSSFKGFHYLKFLSLKNTTFTRETIEYLISNCPLLEKLELLYSNHLTRLKIHAPRLQYLDFEGIFEDLSLVGSSYLTNAYFSLLRKINEAKREYHRKNFYLEKVLGCLPSLQTLRVDANFLQVRVPQFLAMGNILKRLPKTFYHLKNLSLKLNFHDSKEVQTVLCLLRSSPHLEQIWIEACSVGEDAVLEKECFWEDQETVDCEFHHLKFIKVTQIKGEDVEMNFMKYVLSASPKLVKMDFSVEKERMSEELSILRKLLQCQRASTISEVVYLD